MAAQPRWPAEPITRLRAWVEQVYRPGYGHLAATLAPCWASHDLCLYGLDLLSGLWSVLYLQPQRTAGLLSAQAEYQARILLLDGAQDSDGGSLRRHWGCRWGVAAEPAGGGFVGGGTWPMTMQ